MVFDFIQTVHLSHRIPALRGKRSSDDFTFFCTKAVKTFTWSVWVTNIHLMGKTLFASNKIRISTAVVKAALSGTKRDVTMLQMS